MSQLKPNKNFNQSEINKLKQFLVKQGLPQNENIPTDLQKFLLNFGYKEITLLKSEHQLKYIELGGESADDIIKNLNYQSEWISYPNLTIAINGMGQSILYVYKNKHFALYIATDGVFSDDNEDLQYLAPSLDDFLTKKCNLDKLN